MCNTYTFWKVKGSGKGSRPAQWALFRADRPPQHKPPKHAEEVTLSPEEAAFMWSYFGKKNRAGMVSFLRSSKNARAQMLAQHNSPGARAQREADEAHKAKAQADREARCAAERAERAPLVARYAEMTGRTPDDIEKSLSIVCPGRWSRPGAVDRHALEHAAEEAALEPDARGCSPGTPS